jgi:integrase
MLDPRPPNAAAWRGGFELLWGTGPATVHLKAADYRGLPSIYAELCDLDMTAAYALRFCILSATRTSETLYARFDEIDMSAMTRAIGAERMKMKLPHVVPLTDEMIAIVEAMRERHRGELIFASDRHGGRQHPRMLAHVMHRVLGIEASVHGSVRSGFRDWAGDCTEYPREVAEAALAHRPTGVEAAYRRGSALEKRRGLMRDWAAFIVGAQEIDNVIPLRAANA